MFVEVQGVGVSIGNSLVVRVWMKCNLCIMLVDRCNGVTYTNTITAFLLNGDGSNNKRGNGRVVNKRNQIIKKMCLELW